jgi:hypothetical protein
VNDVGSHSRPPPHGANKAPASANLNVLVGGIVAGRRTGVKRPKCASIEAGLGALRDRLQGRCEVNGFGNTYRFGGQPENQDDSLMENNEATDFHKSFPDVTTSNSLFSELIPAYLEYVRVELGRARITVAR